MIVEKMGEMTRVHKLFLPANFQRLKVLHSTVRESYGCLSGPPIYLRVGNDFFMVLNMATSEVSRHLFHPVFVSYPRHSASAPPASLIQDSFPCDISVLLKLRYSGFWTEQTVIGMFCNFSSCGRPRGEFP